MAIEQPTFIRYEIVSDYPHYSNVDLYERMEYFLYYPGPLPLIGDPTKHHLYETEFY